MIGTNNSHVFRPLEWQVSPFLDKSLIMLMDGPAGNGKSYLAAQKVDAFMRKYPNAMGLMVRKTRESMTNSTLLFFDRQIANDNAVVLKKNEKRFEYPNGSILAYGGMKDDAQRDAIRSIGQDGAVDIIWMEEAHLFTRADFDELLARLRGTAAGWRQIIITTNPDSDQHWIYRDLIVGGEASRHVSMTTDNTYLPEDYATVILNKLTGVRRERLQGGKWVSAEGAVYADYRYETHVIEPFEIPGDWRRFRAIDFGYTNPFVCQWWAVDHDGRMYMYREIYMSQRTVSDHAKVINQFPDRIDFTVTDHDAEDRATLRQCGIPTIAAKKDVSPGIEAVQLRLRDAGDGKPRIYFFQGAVVESDNKLLDSKRPASTIDEISGYVYPKGIDGKPNKEHPIKDNDHGMDTMRYAVMAMDARRDLILFATD